MDSFDVILHKIKEREAFIKAALIDGAIHSMEDYKLLVGEARGLLTVHGWIEDLQKHLEFSDE